MVVCKVRSEDSAEPGRSHDSLYRTPHYSMMEGQVQGTVVIHPMTTALHGTAFG